jgi:CysZ protein
MQPTFTRTAGASDFFHGFALPFSALRLVARDKKLFRLSLISSIVTFASLVVLVALLGSRTDDLIGYFWSKPEAWYALPFWYLAVVAAFLILLVVGANTLPLLALAPLQDPISEAAEEAMGADKAPGFTVGRAVKSVAVALSHTATRIGLLLAGHAVLLLLNLIPGAGSIAWTVAASAWTMWWMAGEYLGGPMARHLYSFSDVRAALWARKALAFGFGAAVYLLLWVPVLNFFFIPLAIIGGTLLFRGLVAAGQIPPRG